MLRNIKTPKKMISYLVKRIVALEKLNAAYRLGRRPSSIALDDATDTFEWRKTLEQYENYL